MKKTSKYIDSTILKAFATTEDIEKLCKEAKEFDFASICVNPTFVNLASKLLADSTVKVCTVVGFPLGANTSFIKAQEAKEAVKNGATEIDMVINIGKAKEGKWQDVTDDIKEVVTAIKTNKSIIVKVILETCYLSTDEISKACLCAKEAGADFVKTSTGFGTRGATTEDIILMKKTVGNTMQIKASGGIKTKEDAKKMIDAGADRIGTSNGSACL